MEKTKKRRITLVSRVAAGIAFLALFVLNITVYADKDAGSGKVSLGMLTAKADDGETAGPGGSGWGYETSTVQCPRDRWAQVTTATNSGSSGGVYVNAGGTIPGTSVVAGVGGTYYTGEGSSTLVTQLTETYKDQCLSASWYNYCSIKSCRPLL